MYHSNMISYKPIQLKVNTQKHKIAQDTKDKTNKVRISSTIRGEWMIIIEMEKRYDWLTN